MSKFLYPIYKLKTKSYIKWWLYHKKADESGILSEILEGFSFNLENTLNRKFKLFEIEGNSVQDGSPSPDNEVPIKSAGDNGSINEKITNADGTEEQDYSIFVQQPFRSIGDVRDCFAKVDGVWNEVHKIYRRIFDGTEDWQQASESLPRFNLPVNNAVKGSNTNNPIKANRFRANYAIEDNSIFLSSASSMICIVCDDFSNITEFKEWLSNNNLEVIYKQVTPTYLPCTPEQIEALENKPSTYKDFTIIQSEDETPAYLKIQYYKEG